MRSLIVQTAEADGGRKHKDCREGENNEREDEHNEHAHLHVVGLDLLAQILGGSTDHKAGDEDREYHHDQHAVQARTHAAKDHLVEHEVDEHHHAAQRSQRVVHGVDGAATGVGGDCGKQRGLADAEADFLALHIASRSGEGSGLRRIVNKQMRMRLGPVDGGESDDKQREHGGKDGPAGHLWWGGTIGHGRGLYALTAFGGSVGPGGVVVGAGGTAEGGSTSLPHSRVEWLKTMEPVATRIDSVPTPTRLRPA